MIFEQDTPPNFEAVCPAISAFVAFSVFALSLSSLTAMILLDTLIAVMPIVGLYSQYALIKQRKNIGSFSIDTCGILIVANVLRIMFWFSKGFATNLLVQSFVVLAMTVRLSSFNDTQFCLLDLCIDVGYKNPQCEKTPAHGGNNELEQELPSEYEQEGFWRWNTITPFSNLFCELLVIFTVVFAAVMGLITAFFVHFEISLFGEVIGMVSIGIECLLGFPQLISNQMNRSVEGLSIFMILTWFVGDFIKTVYFIVEMQPGQFIAGGAFQLTVDLLIVIQIMAFKEAAAYEEVKGIVKEDIAESNQISRTPALGSDHRQKSFVKVTDEIERNDEILYQESPHKMMAKGPYGPTSNSSYMNSIEGI